MTPADFATFATEHELACCLACRWIHTGGQACLRCAQVPVTVHRPSEPVHRETPAETPAPRPLEPPKPPPELASAPVTAEVGTIGITEPGDRGVMLMAGQAVQRWRDQPHGGRLKTGGNNGGGRPRESVRLKALEVLPELVDMLWRVANGTELEDVRTPLGVVRAEPTMQARLEAGKTLVLISRVAQPDPKGSKGGQRLIISYEAPLRREA